MWKVARTWALASLLLASCGSLNIYSDAELEPISLQAYEEATRQNPIVTSGPDYDMVQEVARRIAAVTGERFP